MVPLALLSFWGTLWTSNRIRWTLKGRCSFFPLFTSIDCVKKDKNKEVLPVAHFLWPHSQSAASQSFLVFAFHLNVSWGPEQLYPRTLIWGQRCYMFFVQYPIDNISQQHPLNVTESFSTFKTRRRKTTSEKSGQCGVYVIKSFDGDSTWIGWYIAVPSIFNLSKNHLKIMKAYVIFEVIP